MMKRGKALMKVNLIPSVNMVVVMLLYEGA